MRISVVIATCGHDDWAAMAWERAYPSAEAQVGLSGDRPELVIEHFPELSVSAARNAAAGHASGEWLCFLDADDELEPGYTAAMGRAFLLGSITTDWAPLLVPAVRYVYQLPPLESTRPGERSRVFGVSAIPNRGGWPRVNECVIGTLVRADLFRRVGGFREFPSIEDYDLWLRCFDAGAKLVYVEEAVYRAYAAADGRNRDQSSYGRIWSDHLERAAAR